MSTPTPGASPAPTSPPATNTTSPPAPNAPPPSTPSTPPPSSAPPPSTPATPSPPPTSAPPPSTPSSPPPPASTGPPPSTTPSPPPPVSTAPPPATTSSPPPPSGTTPAPSTSSTPPPPPPPTPSTSPPTNSSVSPPPPSSTTSPPPSSAVLLSPPPPSTSGTPSTPSKSPPPPPPATNSSSSSSSSSSGISSGAVIGMVIGGVAVLAVLAILFILFCRKKRRTDDEAGYYPPPPPRNPKDDPYGGGPPQNWRQNAPPPIDPFTGVAKPPPPPGSALRPPYSPINPQYLSMSGNSGSNNSGPENPQTPPPGMGGMGFSKSTFTYEDLALATDGFSDANLLGQGGFGYVHRGILAGGKEVAIKQLKAGSGQGEREFQAEVEIISRVHHKHLVSLVGYCSTGSERLLVYEFVPNNTLEFHLHGKGRPTMEWSTRLKIALGSAKGLAYLHEDCQPKIIHRDIKAANILLDFKFEAMVADFGLAKFFSELNTHVSTRVMGTFGYMAPEYASSGKLTEKSDVFSFGVMLLELITGRKPVDTTQTFMEDSLVDWARPLLNRALDDGNFDALADPRLQNNYNKDEMARVIACAAACVRHSGRRRPKMSQVVRTLEGDASLSDLNDGIRPGHSSIYSGSSDYDASQYNEDLKKFRKMALGSQEYGASSEYSAPTTSEYGLNPSGSSSEVQTTQEMELGTMRKRESK